MSEKTLREEAEEYAATFLGSDKRPIIVAFIAGAKAMQRRAVEIANDRAGQWASEGAKHDACRCVLCAQAKVRANEASGLAHSIAAIRE